MGQIGKRRTHHMLPRLTFFSLKGAECFSNHAHAHSGGPSLPIAQWTRGPLENNTLASVQEQVSVAYPFQSHTANFHTSTHDTHFSNCGTTEGVEVPHQAQDFGPAGERQPPPQNTSSLKFFPPIDHPQPLGAPHTAGMGGTRRHPPPNLQIQVPRRPLRQKSNLGICKEGEIRPLEGCSMRSVGYNGQESLVEGHVRDASGPSRGEWCE